MKLNLGCGNDYREGYVNIDNYAEADVKTNLEETLPFADNSIEEILAYRILEHITPNKWVFLLNEIERIAKDGCILKIIVPFDNILNRTTLDHYRTFSYGTFWTLEQDRKIDTPKIRLRLKRLTPLPKKFLRVIYYLFPLLKQELELTYEVKK